MKRDRLVTVAEMIKELQQIPAEYQNCEVASIGTWCGYDRPCDYTIKVRAEKGAKEFRIGRRGEN